MLWSGSSELVTGSLSDSPVMRQDGIVNSLSRGMDPTGYWIRILLPSQWRRSTAQRTSRFGFTRAGLNSVHRIYPLVFTGMDRGTALLARFHSGWTTFGTGNSNRASAHSLMSLDLRTRQETVCEPQQDTHYVPQSTNAGDIGDGQQPSAPDIAVTEQVPLTSRATGTSITCEGEYSPDRLGQQTAGNVTARQLQARGRASPGGEVM